MGSKLSSMLGTNHTSPARARKSLNRNKVGPKAGPCLSLGMAALPVHYTFMGRPILDTLVLKYAGTPEGQTQQFQQAVARLAPQTTVRILVPGEPLLVTA